ncbi:MAG: hypothetical protein JW920_07690 [Deltaproteobacteria bacterium]|nr:hypothetical protein [Deltaproteobacteria bacterium]
MIAIIKGKRYNTDASIEICRSKKDYYQTEDGECVELDSGWILYKTFKGSYFRYHYHSYNTGNTGKKGETINPLSKSAVLAFLERERLYDVLEKHFDIQDA